MRRPLVVSIAALFIGTAACVGANSTLQPASASGSFSSPAHRPAAILRVVPVGQNPRDVAISERTHHVFVVSAGPFDVKSGNYRRNGTVTMLDALTGVLLRTVSAGWRGSASLVIDDRAARVLVVNTGDASTGYEGSVTLLDTRTGARVKTVAIGQIPTKLVIDVQSWKAFILTSVFPPARIPSDGQVKVLAITRGIVLKSVSVGPHPEGLALDDRTNAVFVLATAKITVLSGATGGVIGTLGKLAQGAPAAIGVDSKTGRLFEASSGDSHGGLGAITTIDDRTGKVVHTTTEDVSRGAYWLLVDAPVNRVLAGESTAAGFPDVAVVDAKSGALLHRLNLNFLSSTLDQKTGKIYFVSSPRTIKVLNPYGWRIVQTIHLALDPGAMIVTQNPRRLFITNPNNGSVTVL